VPPDKQFPEGMRQRLQGFLYLLRQLRELVAAAYRDLFGWDLDGVDPVRAAFLLVDGKGIDLFLAPIIDDVVGGDLEEPGAEFVAWLICVQGRVGLDEDLPV